MRDPSVRMIGHLSARMIGGRPPIELDLDAVFAAAEETGTALEVNGALPRSTLGRRAAPRADARRHLRAHERRPPRARARAREQRCAQRREGLDAARAGRQRLAAEKLATWATEEDAVTVEITYCVR
jgi:hypothetical protein